MSTRQLRMPSRQRARLPGWVLTWLIGCSPGPPATSCAAPAPQEARVPRAPNAAVEPDWVIPYGGEFWRHSPAPRLRASTTTRPLNEAAAGIELSRVIERVSHAFRRIDHEPDSLRQVRALSYVAELGPEGLRFSPQIPQRSAKAANKTDVTATLRLARLFRGEQVIHAGGAGRLAWRITGNVGQTLLEEPSGLIEHHEALADGVHVSWVLRHAPNGAGPLQLELEVSGLHFHGSSAGGQHFADATGRPRLRVGQARFVDANGTAVDLLTHETDGRLRIVVPDTALEAAAYPAVVDPVIGAEFGMDDPVPGLAIGEQSSAALASDGTNYLAVWQDTRAGAEEDVFGTRVNGGGVVLDPEGIAICRAPGLQGSAAVAWGGTTFCVVWQDERTPDETDIYGARVTPSGIVLEPDGFPICTLPGVQQEPALAGRSNGFLVVWQHARGGLSDNIHGTGISPDGTVLNPNGVPILPSALAQAHPAVASGADGYLVVWDANAGASIEAVRVAADRAVLDSNALLVTSAPGKHEFPTAAFAGGDYLVAWLDHLTASSSSFNIYGSRISPNGSVREVNGFPICTNAAEQSGPAIAGNGGEFLVVWHDLRNGIDYDIYGTKVSVDGVVQQTNGFPILTAAGTQFAPAVASDGVGFLVAWTDSRAGSADIRGTRISGAARVVDPSGLLVSRTANRQLKPAAAASADRYLVVWEDYRNLTNLQSLTADIYGCRISASGTILDVDGLAIASAPNRRRNPAVASDGTNFLVIWEQEGISDLYGARVSSSGGVLDSGGFPITLAANNQLSPALAYANGIYLAVWDDSRSFSTYDIYGSRITPAGVVLDSGGIPISTATGNQQRADVSALGTNFLVVWQDARAGGNRIYGARVTPGGTILDLGNVLINSTSSDPQSPRVAGDGTNCLVVWQAFDLGNASNDILGARVSPTASVIGPSGFRIGQSTGRQYNPDVAWAGGNYLVAWEDDRAAFETWDIYGTRVSPLGLVLDTNGLPLATTAGSQTLTALAAIGSTCLVIHEGPDPSGVERIEGTLVVVDAEPCLPAPAGVVAWWTADGNAGDAVGGNHGVAASGGDFVAGEVGQGFRAGTGYFRVPDSPSLRPEQVTAMAWVMGTNVGTYQYILSKSYLGVGSSYGLYAGAGSPGGLYFYVWGRGFSPFAPPSTWDGRFHHVAGTYDGLTIRLYLDGSEVGTGTSASGPINYGMDYLAGDLFVASVDPSQPEYNWPGIVDEVAIFNRALSASEIASLYAAGSLGMCGPPRIAESPINRTIGAGGETILDVSVRGEDLSYQWWRNGVPVPGATNSSLTLRNADALAAGEYWVVISNGFGSTTSSNAIVTVLVPPTITSQPQSQTVFAGAPASFTVEASGSLPLGFTWLHNGEPVATFVQTQAVSMLPLPHALPSDEGVYQVMVTNVARPAGIGSEAVTLTVLSAPTILQQPTNLTAAVEAPASFCVSVIGSGPLRFQWRHNGVNVPGATNSCLIIPHVQVTDGGTYSAVIENPVNTLTSQSAQLIVNVPFAPASDNFANRLTLVGTNGVVRDNNLLATVETGERPPAGNPGGHSVWYAWMPPANGVVTFSTVGSSFDTVMAIYLGSTLDSLTVVGDDDDSGSFFSSRVQIQSEVEAGRTYAIQIDGAFGATGQIVLSWQFEATPELLPVISTPPVSRSVLRGSNATFSVTASGAGLRYQWYLNGTLLTGATNTSLTITNVQPANLGLYLVKVLTASGLHEVTAAAVLEIGPVPDLQSQDKFESLFQPHPGPGGIAPAAADGFFSVSVGVPLALLVNNTNSTTQQFEPVECRIDGASRWLQIHVAQTSVCILDTIGSQIDTVLGVYTGSDLLSLVQVGCDDNGAPDGIRSQLRFPAAPGIDYRVRVDGVNGAQGVIALNARLGQPPAMCTNLLTTNLFGTNLVLAAGAGLTLRVPCPDGGLNGIRYQWQLNGTNLPGATNETLELPVNAAAGRYAVVTFNEYGGFTTPLGAIPIPYLTRPVVLANGRVRVVVQRPANQAVVLETTADLRTWVPWQTVPRTVPGPVVEMPAAPDMRWFRARPVP